MEAAAAVNSPVILQGSAGARKYAGEAFLRHLVEAAVETWPDIPVAMHQDHGSSPAVCQQSIRSGFTSVMMDGSLMTDAKTPASYEYNVEVTKRVCEMAHVVGVTVEGELGVLGSLETGEAGEEDGVGAEGKLTRDQMLTDPEQAADFVAADRLRRPRYRDRHEPRRLQVHQAAHRRRALDRPSRARFTRKLPNTHLVMHGSSSVPQEWLAVIREFGGDMKETYGVPFEEIKEGIRNGVRKVNIDTDIRLAMTGAMRTTMAEDPSAFDPRAFLEGRAGCDDGAVRRALRRVRLGGVGRARSRRFRLRRWLTATPAGAIRPRTQCYSTGAVRRRGSVPGHNHHTRPV